MVSNRFALVISPAPHRRSHVKLPQLGIESGVVLQGRRIVLSMLAIRLESLQRMLKCGLRVGQMPRSSASNRENDVSTAQLILTQLARVDRRFRKFCRGLETPAVFLYQGIAEKSVWTELPEGRHVQQPQRKHGPIQMCHANTLSMKWLPNQWKSDNSEISAGRTPLDAENWPSMRENGRQSGH